MENPQGLTDKQCRFIAEYVVDWNGKRAAEAAGYGKGAAVRAANMLRNPKIKRIIDRVKRQDLKVKGLEAKDVREKVAQSLHRDLRQLADANGLVFSDIRQIPPECHCFIDGFDVTQYYDDEGNISSQKIKIRLSPNASAQDLAAKLTGAFTPVKEEVTHTLDWDMLYGRKTIDVDPFHRALEEEKNGADGC